MDILDFLKPHTRMPCMGKYRKTLNDEPKIFEYAEVDKPSNSFSEVINNIIITRQGMVVRTRTQYDFEPNEYISTQDGRLWTVTEVQRDDFKNENLRFLKRNFQSEITIALIGIDNPMEI